MALGLRGARGEVTEEQLDAALDVTKRMGNL